MLIVEQIKRGVASVTGLCESDPRVLDYINEACELLIWDHPSKQTYALVELVLDYNFISWPRNFAAIEAASYVDGARITVRNGWYEFLQHGPGPLKIDCGYALELVPRPPSPIRRDFVGPKTIEFIPIVGEASNTVINIQGTDVDGEPIRTNYPVTVPPVTWIEGENVTLSTVAGTGISTTKSFYSITRVIKPATRGPIKVQTTGGIGDLKTIWQPDDRLPEYRRSLLPGLTNLITAPRTIRVMARLRQVDVTRDNDFIIPSNRSAIETMCQSIYLRKQNRLTDCVNMAALAMSYLEKQASCDRGGEIEVPNLDHGTTFGAAGLRFVQ